jgi:hypothetical protein
MGKVSDIPLVFNCAAFPLNSESHLLISMQTALEFVSSWGITNLRRFKLSSHDTFEQRKMTDK